MTVGTQNLTLVDERFGDGPRYYLTEPKDIHMRVPDQVRNTVLFVGLPEVPEPEYCGTAFIVTVPGKRDNHFAFVVTARHVAEHLDGKAFYLRVNKRDGGLAIIHGTPETPWFYHPTDRYAVDAAVTLFAPQRLSELDIEHIPIELFVDDAKIREFNIGVGDEVFMTGLFTKIVETTRNIPIVRTGNVAMMPGEKIPFKPGMIDAYLVESRSIGGLSGSPVFVRPTIRVPGSDEKSGDIVYFHGVGKILFFGSAIGHWDIPTGFTTTSAEAVNMGVSPIVPAPKIKEIIMQSKLVEIMDKIDDEMRKRNQKGATLDFAPGNKQKTEDGFEIPVPSEEQFFDGLKKATRKITNEK